MRLIMCLDQLRNRKSFSWFKRKPFLQGISAVESRCPHHLLPFRCGQDRPRQGLGMFGLRCRSRSVSLSAFLWPFWGLNFKNIKLIPCCFLFSRGIMFWFLGSKSRSKSQSLTCNPGQWRRSGSKEGTDLKMGQRFWFRDAQHFHAFSVS